MPHKESAGLLLFRRHAGVLEVLLAHPGGPYWAHRDDGAWTIPKGGIHPGEDPLQTAIREFIEETSFEPVGPFLPLGQITQRSGKLVHAWAFEGDCDPSRVASVTDHHGVAAATGPDHRDSGIRPRRLFPARPTPAAPSTWRRSSSSTDLKGSCDLGIWRLEDLEI